MPRAAVAFEEEMVVACCALGRMGVSVAHAGLYSASVLARGLDVWRTLPAAPYCGELPTPPSERRRIASNDMFV